MPIWEINDLLHFLYFADDNSTSGEIIRKETRYGVDRVTSVILYSPVDDKNVKDVTCTVIVNNVTFIATHEVNIIFGGKYINWIIMLEVRYRNLF